MRRGRLALAAAAALAFLACRQLVGIGDTPAGAQGADASAGDADGAADEGGPACGAFPWATTRCAQCTASGCCTEATQCRDDGLCGVTFDCIAACAAGDDLCRSACVTASDDTMSALGACQATSCATECDLQCGGVYGLLPGLAGLPSDCRACLTLGTSCWAEGQCAQTPNCLAAQLCKVNCSAFDWICQGNCAVSHPYDPIDGGVGQLNSCAGSCPTGTTWDCLGHVTWPIGTAATITLRFAVTEFQPGDLAQAAVPGVTVTPCGKDFGDSCHPVAPPVTSDANGIVSFTVNAPFNGYVELVKAGYVTSLAYLYPFPIESVDPSPDFQGSLYVFQPSALQTLAAFAGGSYDPKLGMIYARILDCAGSPASGVSFAGTSFSDGGSTPQSFYYDVDGTPDGKATVTTALGLGGFTNVPPGSVRFVASENGTTAAVVETYVRANALTTLDPLVPTP